MSLERFSRLALAASIAVAVFYLLAQAGLAPAPWTADEATVEVVDDGETIAVVEAEVAATWAERRTGLSEHDSLEDGEGMLFVHRDEAERTYVMREMDFAIDIIFVGADGEITTVHHARAPGPDEDGTDLRYSGRAKWVLEVPRGYANETGISAGDEVRISTR